MSVHGAGLLPGLYYEAGTDDKLKFVLHTGSLDLSQRAHVFLVTALIGGDAFPCIG